MKDSSQWSRLDNAAKIFPPTSTKSDTKVFRFVCELYEDIDPVILQKALDRTIKQFPFYRSVLKKGLFWYYFENSSNKPKVRPETKPPCSPIYNGDSKNLLFEVTYYKKRINLEVFHALSDGTGSMYFLRFLVLFYITEKHKEDFDQVPNLPDYDASAEQKRLDSFSKYYSKQKGRTRNRLKGAYRLRGEKYPEHRLGIITGRISVKSLLELSHKHNATLSEFLASVMIFSIHEGMSVREEQKPVVITIPVDLRRYFPTVSARNFFGVINVAHDFKKQGREFEDILENIKTAFKKLLTEDFLRYKMNKMSSLEHNIPAKAVPLILKNFVLKIGNYVAETEITAAFSNVGKVVMPPEVSKHIRLFDIFVSTKRLQACMCSFEDAFVISFTSPHKSTNIQRCFFRKLTSMGVEAEVVSNITGLEPAEQPEPAADAQKAKESNENRVKKQKKLKKQTNIKKGEA